MKSLKSQIKIVEKNWNKLNHLIQKQFLNKIGINDQA